MLGAYEITLLTGVGIAVTAALSLNLITGFCGQINLGHAAFLGVGAYCTAILMRAGVPFPIGLLAGGVLAGLMGALVGLTSLRVRDDFLAITTMGIAFLFVGIVRQQDALGGDLGISGIPESALGKPGFMLLTLAIAAATTVFSAHVKRSWMGFSFDAIAQDEDTARLVGLDSSRYKVTAFIIGTAIGGIAGGLYAQHIRFIGPESFGFIESITLLAMVVIGGVGSILGVIVAAAGLTVLPQWSQFVAEYKLLLYGALLFAIMRFSPGGLAELARRVFRRPARKAE